MRYTCGFLAICLLNCSVDAPDVTLPNQKENLALNDQESIVELIVEKCLGYDDAIPEYDDQDDEDTQGKKFSVDFFILPHISIAAEKRVFLTKESYFHSILPLPETADFQFSPPPEA